MEKEGGRRRKGKVQSVRKGQIGEEADCRRKRGFNEELMRF